MSSREIDRLIDEVQRRFDGTPGTIEPGLDVEEPSVLQLRKGCRLLAGSDRLLEAGYFTLVVEASFGAIERTVEFRLIERGQHDPRSLPGSHTGIYREAATCGLFSERIANDLADLWRDHRARTYYRDGLATEERARHLADLASEVHDYVVGRSSRSHECLCSQ